MNQKSLLSGLFAVCVVFGFGCASADDVSLENDAASDEAVVPGPPAGQCVAACQKVSTTNITGLCCVCNGAVKKFARHPAIASMYVCK